VVWQSVVNGQTLKFRLAGINNQNFIMKDEETGSWWQQISGEAIQGPLKGQKLTPVETDELTFDTWKRENPDGRVLLPDEKIRQQQKYEPADWESQVAKMPVRVSAKLDDALEPRSLIVGILIDGKAKAYPFSAIEKQSPILDTLGGRDIVILLADDGKSVRAFERNVNGQKLEFLKNADSNELIDAETASVWDFTGKAANGPLAGTELKKIPVLKDYWFDWKIYNPETELYLLGAR
jgi:hypothetical protein